MLLVAQPTQILDITAVNIALLSLASDMNLTGASISWAITSYSLIFGSLLSSAVVPLICSVDAGSS